MWRAERTRREQRVLWIDQARDAVDRARLDCLVGIERRQDRRKGSREQRLAGAGWPDEQKVVRTRRRDLERALWRLLPDDVAEIARPPRRGGGCWSGGGRDSRRAVEMRDRLAQRREGHRLRAEGGGLAGVASRYVDPGDPGREGTPDARHRSPDRTERAVEGELAQAEPVGLQGQLTRRAKDRERDRQVEAGAFLPALRGSQVHGDPAERELEPGIADRGPDPLARLLDRGIGEPDDREVREPVRDIDLDGHKRRLEAPEGAAQRPRDRAHGSMSRPSGRPSDRTPVRDVRTGH